LMDGVPLADAVPMLGHNLAAAYRVDMSRIQPIADRIGPLPIELGVTVPL
jgi:hypothetical protein